MIRISLILITALLMIGCSTGDPKSQLDKKKILVTKINSLLNQSENNLNDRSTQFECTIKGIELSQKNDIDSLTAKSLLQLVKLSYPLMTKDSFLHYYPKSLSFSKLIKDSFYIAQTHNYVAYFYQKHHNIDSAYYHFYQASKCFKSLKNEYQTGKMLLNMAIIQKNKRDYKGSEEVTKEALEYLTKSNSKRYIASAYNNLGITNNNQNKFSTAIKYHRRSLAMRKELENVPILIVESLNNIMVTYKNKGDYRNAFAYYDSILPYKMLLEDHPIVKARVMDNIAHTRLLSSVTKGVLKDMEEALAIRRREDHLTGIMVSLLHLSEYYSSTNNPKKSFQYALEAKKLSGENQNLRDVLKALRVLTLNEFGKGNTDFIEEYYATLDHIEKVENSVADYFARIRFEADEKGRIIQQKNNELKRKKTISNIYFFMFALFLITILTIFFYKKYQRERLRKELEAGFDIYLKKKYQLTARNLEFWKSWITKSTQKEVADELFISIDAIKSRRKSLKNKVNNVEKINGDFNKSKAITIYNEELTFFRDNTISNK